MCRRHHLGRLTRAPLASAATRWSVTVSATSPSSSSVVTGGDASSSASRKPASTARAHDEGERRAVRVLRPRLRALWDADGDDELVVLVNDLLSSGKALPQLARHGEWGYHLHATSADAPFATRWMVEAAMAMVDVLRAGETWRLKTCAADDCQDVLVDMSKNRSRRFCDGGCGNRTNGAATRARLKSGDHGPRG